MATATADELRIGVAGLGAIGMALARALDRGIPGSRLVAASGRDPLKTADFLMALKRPVDAVPLARLAEVSDVVIECLPSALLADVVGPALEKGRKVIVLSVGALLQHPELTNGKRANGGQILVPTGALIGLDAVTAAAEGTIRSVRMITRKPPRGLAGAPYLVEKRIEIGDLAEPLKVFEGTAREAARGFPANLNVAVALSLAGIGPDRTVLEIWADPRVTRNIHRIEVDSDAASFAMSIENIPSENPKTGRITSQSVLAMLRKMRAPLRVGT